MVRGSNPTMREEVFQNASSYMASSSEAMTINGSLKKTGILLLLVLGSAALGWAFPVPVLALGLGITAFVLAIIVGFKPTSAPTLAPVYALIKGYAVGVFSLLIQSSLADSKSAVATNAVPVAVLGTMVTLGVMLFLYAKRIIRVTETLRSVVIGATAAIAITYFLSFVVWMFAPNFINGLAIFKGGPIGILFSVFVIGLAAFNFLLDFDVIEHGANTRAPKYMEWYGAFGLTVTIVWLYIEILRLIQKIFGSR